MRGKTKGKAGKRVEKTEGTNVNTVTVKDMAGSLGISVLGDVLLDKIRLTGDTVTWKYVSPDSAAIAEISISRDAVRNLLPFKSEYILPDILSGGTEGVRKKTTMPGDPTYPDVLTDFFSVETGIFVNMGRAEERAAIKEIFQHFSESEEGGVKHNEYRFVATTARVFKIKADNADEASKKIEDTDLRKEVGYSLIRDISKGKFSITQV